MPEAQASSYDDVAGMYHALWADWYLPAAMPALERLFFSQVPGGTRVLDLCCGSGHVTKELVARGYTVTGVDNSAELIALAKKDLPEIDFRVQDARDLVLDGKYGAVLSTFDSLNHILNLSELAEVFRGVVRSLEPGGLFVFDMNLEEAYMADLREWAVDIRDASVGLVRGKFDPALKKASTELIWFVDGESGNCWRQYRSTVEQQCYPQADILMALNQAGFRTIEAVPAREAGVTSELGFGRTYFAARVSE
ncbi:MAG: methyltransferase domain-containing protein [Acidobacteriota bacterium]|nr:methyltransferase domain-containing protein [Acidobacteriota bacterium]MDQ2843127.1 methyltransferase domain-containing protein [Acidobacteriota bacterium]